MDSTSEKTAQQASESDEEIIDLVEEVSDTTAEDDEEIIELTEAVEEAPAETVAPLAEEKQEGPDPATEYKGAEEADFLADVGMEIEPESSETVPGAEEVKIDRETILSQLPKDELEAIITRAAKEVIGEIAERVVTKVAERAISDEIEKIKSALK